MSTSRSALTYFLGLFVRHWSANMTLVFARYGWWPGFSYTNAEKQEMQAIEEAVPSLEYFIWLGLVVVLSLAAFAIVVTLGAMGMIAAIGGDGHLKTLSTPLFFFFLYCLLVLCLCGVLPVVMVLSSGIVGRWFGVAVSLLPDVATTTRYFRKIWSQFVRITIVTSTIAVMISFIYWLIVPADSNLGLLLRAVVPMLVPLFSILSTGWVLAGRLGRQTEKVAPSAEPTSNDK
jgi:hypothetical protein